MREGGVKVVAIHLTDASAYYSHLNEELLKQHIKKVGKTNVALNSLRDTSRDTIVLPRKNGKKCAVIPHNPSVPEEILQELYRGMMSSKIILIMCKYCLWSHICIILFILPQLLVYCHLKSRGRCKREVWRKRGDRRRGGSWRKRGDKRRGDWRKRGDKRRVGWSKRGDKRRGGSWRKRRDKRRKKGGSWRKRGGRRKRVIY